MLKFGKQRAEMGRGGKPIGCESRLQFVSRLRCDNEISKEAGGKASAKKGNNR